MLGRGHGHAFGHVLAAAANLQVFERAAVAEPVQADGEAGDGGARLALVVHREVGGVGVLQLRVAVADVVVVLVVLLRVVAPLSEAVRVALEEREFQRQGDRPGGDGENH